jgi:nicotinamide-nucleotide amidase
MGSAVIVTIGNEIVSGDIANSNGAWLAKRLETLGISVDLLAALPDDVNRIATFVREQVDKTDVVLVTGGLGGTPDDVTREAIAAAFDVEQREVPELVARLRARFHRSSDYVTPWARLPVGSRPIENPLGGAPGFVLANVYVLPGLPSEMEAMFDEVEHELRRERPIASWRRRYRTRESEIVGVLTEMCERYPSVLVGSYPSFDAEGPEVEVVVKSNDPQLLASAAAWIEGALDDATSEL